MGAWAQYEERRRQWEAFHRWEAEQPPMERPAADVVADLGAILEWMPREALAEDPDPQKLGIQAMKRALAQLTRSMAPRHRTAPRHQGRGR
jgi:hypothetical protein